MSSAALSSLGSSGTSAADSSGAFALDPKALAALKAKAGGSADSQKAALKQAATQFEAMFMNMLLKTMRDSLPQDGMMDSQGTKTYTAMMDQQLSQKLSGTDGKGIGLADMIVKQMDKKFVDPAALKDADGVSGSSSTLQMLQQANKAAGAATNMKSIRSNGGAAYGASGVNGVNGSNAANAVNNAYGASAAGGSGSAAPLSGNAKEFVQSRWADAKAAEQVSGVPAQFILGQAALESGWGKRDIKYADGSTSHNLFGIKAGPGWKGATVDATTTEYVNGVARKSVEKFRAYSSYAESFADYAKLLTSNPRYANTLKAGTNAAQFANSLQAAGYATDPNYAQKLTGVINQTLRAVA